MLIAMTGRFVPVADTRKFLTLMISALSQVFPTDEDLIDSLYVPLPMNPVARLRVSTDVVHRAIALHPGQNDRVTKH
ncbi:MAG: hypothetical protein LJE92_14930 [Gammaproteobacteria bacterium]|nr:hypothetical protein [Gammaproteobacteria bacterium]